MEVGCLPTLQSLSTLENQIADQTPYPNDLKSGAKGSMGEGQGASMK